MATLTPDAVMVDAFRARMPGFSNSTTWPFNAVEMALCEAIQETNEKRWGKYKDECGNFRQRGIFFFAAHWLSSTYVTGSASDASNINPSARLNLSGKSVGDESVEYRITAIQSTGDDWLSTTIYGTQFLRLRQRAGMGCVAV